MLLLTWLHCVASSAPASSPPPQRRGSAETSEQQAAARRRGNCRGGCFLPAPSVDTLLGLAERYLLAFPFHFLDAVASPQLHFFCVRLRAGRRSVRVSAAEAVGAVGGSGDSSGGTRNCSASLGLAKPTYGLWKRRLTASAVGNTPPSLCFELG